ncbi:MAG: hypothetical protein ACI87J_002329 [Colwellia sp.]|jgi:hypothetical protein
MSVTTHPTGGNRAYKKIGGVEHQLYSFDIAKADAMQVELEAKSKRYNSLKSPVLFSPCGRLVYLRVRKYKQTDRATFQLQLFKNGKQVKTENLIKDTFESQWKVFLKLWREHFSLSMIEVIEDKELFKRAKRLYMQDVYKIENQHG